MNFDDQLLLDTVCYYDWITSFVGFSRYYQKHAYDDDAYRLDEEVRLVRMRLSSLVPNGR